MTLDDLEKIYGAAYWTRPELEPDGARRAGIAAVIRALRDEMSGPEWGDTRLWFDEILGDAGEKVAGGPTREDGRTTDAAVSLYAAADGPPAPATSLPKCVWTKLPKFGFSISCTDKWLMNSNYGGDTCPECGRLIEYKFTEAQR